MPSLGAKNWLLIGCREAGQRAAILYTIVENCRQLGIDTREDLEDALSRLPGMKAYEAITLTLENWLCARQASRSGKRPEASACQGKSHGCWDHAYFLEPQHLLISLIESLERSLAKSAPEETGQTILCLAPHGARVSRQIVTQFFLPHATSGGKPLGK